MIKLAKPQQFKAKKKYNPNVSCTYYGKTGYTQKDCYRLIGFPDDFKFTNPKPFQAQVRGNAIATVEEDEHMLGKTSEAGNINILQQ